MTVAVTFPKQKFFVVYTRHSKLTASDYDNTLDSYDDALEDDGYARVALMNGLPVLIGGNVRLVAGGTDITVRGDADQPTLVSAAQSIADQSAPPATGQFGVISGVELYPRMPAANEIAVSQLSATLGASVVLPDPALVNASQTAQAWAGGKCPQPDATGSWDGSAPDACWLWISYPGTSLRVGYARAALPGGEWMRDRGGDEKFLTDVWLYNSAPPPIGPSKQAAGPSGASGPTGASGPPQTGDPIPAVLIPKTGPFPGWVEFDIDGNRVIVGGDYDTATLQALAQSIVDGFQPK